MLALILLLVAKYWVQYSNEDNNTLLKSTDYARKYMVYYIEVY